MANWVHRQFHGDHGRQGRPLARLHADAGLAQQMRKRQGISIPGSDDSTESAAGNSAVESVDDAATTSAAQQQQTTSAGSSPTTSAQQDTESDAATSLAEVSSQIADTTSATAQSVDSSSSVADESSEQSSVAVTTESSSSPATSTAAESSSSSSSAEESTLTSTEVETTTSSKATSTTSTSASSEALSSGPAASQKASESTNIHYITGSNSASASSSSSADSDDSPSTGAVIGIVAGGLVGAVVLAGILGYFFKAKCSNKDDEDELAEAAFNKDDFRRESVMLSGMDDDDRMSMRSASQAGSGLSRAGTTMLPGLGRNNTVVPRPPSMFERHLYSTSPSPYQQNYGGNPMGMGPSFEPGQVVNTGQQYYAGSDGGWTPAPAGYGQNLQPNYAQSQVGLARADTVFSHYPDNDPIARTGSAQSYYADLQRQASQASSQGRGGGNSSSVESGYQPAAPQAAHLSNIAEDDYDLHRTGTLEDPNPQQTYFGDGYPRTTTSSNGLKNPYDM